MRDLDALEVGCASCWMLRLCEARILQMLAVLGAGCSGCVKLVCCRCRRFQCPDSPIAGSPGAVPVSLSRRIHLSGGGVASGRSRSPPAWSLVQEGLFGSWRQLVEVFTLGLGIQPPLVPFTPPFGYLLSGLFAALFAVFFPLGFQELFREEVCQDHYPPRELGCSGSDAR